ncbi:MAG: hypothetical protein COB23_01360 [Methylophaga sp.]|nr:MAG: hypothetical protein COB23_01360 [Methylophaga sp.]
MAYIQRNPQGEIIAVSDTQQTDEQEYLSIDDPQLIEYFTKSGHRNSFQTALSESDIALIRVLEDLINTLIDQKVILFTDLPLAAREKLSNREKIRGHLNSLENLMDDGEGIL